MTNIKGLVLLFAALICPAVFAAGQPAATAATSFTNFAQTFGLAKNEETVVDPDKAFRVDVIPVDPSTIRVRFTIDDCCYLYRDKISLSVTAPDGARAAAVRLGSYQLPPGEVMTDEFFGRTEVYRRSVDVLVPIQAGNVPANEAILSARYQGCAEKGVKICYPPTTRTIPFHMAAVTAADASTPPSSGFLWSVLSAFIGGVLLTFTPCVLPMVPILSGAIVGTEGARLTKLRGGLLSYAYVLGTALTYTIAGAIAGATGEQLQAYFQNAWAIGLFSAVIVLLALSMFGLYELRLPSSLQTLLYRHSKQLHHDAKSWIAGEFVGVFLLGAISALIIGACVAPVLAFTLGSAIATRDPWLGGAIMFALAHGQGLFLVAIGVSEGVLLPRSGPWMQVVRYVFGVLLLGVAIYLVSFVPGIPVLFLWAALLIVTAVYLGATQNLPAGAGGQRYLWKGVGTLLLVWGVLALIGAFAGNRDILNPLAFSFSGRTDMPDPARAASLFVPVKTVQELEQRLADARAAGKPVILDYYATWCADCVRMESSTFLDPRVRAAVMTRFVPLQADVTDPGNPDARAIKQRFGVYGPPAVLMFSKNGEEQRNLRIYGYKSSEEFLALLAAL